MALGKCFQVSSVSTAGVGVRHPHYPFGCKKQPNPTKAKGLTKPIKAFSSSPSLALSFHHSCLRSSSSLICKAHETVNEAQVVTDSSWEKLVVASERPVLVEFWAPWCGPCRMIAPVIDELAREYAGKIACFKLNTDDCPDIATQCGIRSIPTVLFFKDGQKKESIIGAVPKSTLAATIDKYLNL